MSLPAEQLPFADEHVVPAPHGEYGGEHQVASFKEYRSLCDEEVSNFRHVGLLDPEGYGAAVQDGRTVFCDIGGRKVPALAPVEYEGGYDAQRCRSLTERPQVMLLTVPLSRVEQGALARGNLSGGEELTNDFAVLIEEPASSQEGGHQEDHQRIVGQLSGLGNFEAKEFIDPRLIDQEGYETAWMALYSCPVAPRELAMTHDQDKVAYIGDPGEHFGRAWERYRQEKGLPEMPSADSEENYVFSPQQLQANKALVDELWGISEEGFGSLLGAYHPVSMEETKELFESLLFSDGSYTLVRFHEGKPVCFGNLTYNMDVCEWLNAKGTPFARELETAEQRGELPVYFSEVISSSSGGAYAQGLFRLGTEMAVARTGLPHRILFESTNLSSCYIPRMVNRLFTRSDQVHITNEAQGVVEVDRLDYWYAVPNAAN